MTKTLRTLLAGAAFLIVQPAAAQDTAQQSPWHEASGVDPITPADRIYGNAQADFSLIVWLDPECPYCKMLGSVPERVVDAASGKLNLSVRLYPLSFHGKTAVIASASALCVADQGGPAAYYRFLDAYLAMTGGNGKGLTQATRPAAASEAVAALAAAAGANDAERLTDCAHAAHTGERLRADMASGDKAHISGTPAIVIRNNRSGETIMAEGALSADDIMAAANYMANRPG